jgi:methylthioribose-1-phosphate isomerase
MKNVSALSLKVEDQRLFCLDQTQLPHREVWVDATSPQEMDRVIKNLQVRGAPLIGVAAALCLGLYVERENPSPSDFERRALMLRQSRPTAVNLMSAVDRLLRVYREEPLGVAREALNIFEEDVALCARIAENGAELIGQGDGILTHCNTGGLATVGAGTALGVILKAHEQGKDVHVYVDETRPLLQGARLNTWELEKSRVPYTLICDNMAAFLMAQGKVSKVIVGADRIAMNGDFANKVGTYSLAVLCHYHRIPFYVAAPGTTLDVSCASGKEIPIEERSSAEVLREWAPKGADVWNPAFDVTPWELVSAWILDRGVFYPEEVRKGVLKEQV